MRLAEWCGRAQSSATARCGTPTRSRPVPRVLRTTPLALRSRRRGASGARIPDRAAPGGWGEAGARQPRGHHARATRAGAAHQLQSEALLRSAGTAAPFPPPRHPPSRPLPESLPARFQPSIPARVTRVSAARRRARLAWSLSTGTPTESSRCVQNYFLSELYTNCARVRAQLVPTAGQGRDGSAGGRSPGSAGTERGVGGAQVLPRLEEGPIRPGMNLEAGPPHPSFTMQDRARPHRAGPGRRAAEVARARVAGAGAGSDSELLSASQAPARGAGGRPHPPPPLPY